MLIGYRLFDCEITMNISPKELDWNAESEY